MDWGSLFFSFSGRINRAKYWLAALLLLLAILIPSLLAAATMSIAAWILFGVVLIGVVVCGLAVAAKRLHDRDKSAWWLLLFYLAPGLLGALGDATGDVGAIFHVISFGISIWALIELGFLRGTAGANRFGPDPLGAAVPQPGEARSGP